MTPKYERLYNKSMMVRGGLINDTIFLEKVIDEWLSKYFCSNKVRKNELFEMVFCNDRLTYNSKIQVFHEIVKNHCKSFNRQNPKLINDLEDIGRHRNIFAHWMLDTSEPLLESGELRFLKSRDFDKYELYDNTKVIGITETIDKCKILIRDLVHPPLE